MAVPVRSELISAVGDFGARLSGATQRRIETAQRELRAAARALPRAEDLFAMPRRMFDELANRIGRALLHNTHAHRSQYERVAARLSPAGLNRMTERARERLNGVVQRKAQSLAGNLERAKARLESLAKLLDVVSYRSVLERGFALVSDFEDREPIRSAAAVPSGKALDIEFHDGHVRAVSGGATTPRPRKRRAPDDGSQGSLL